MKKLLPLQNQSSPIKLGTTISCTEKGFIYFQKAYTIFGIFNPYSLTLDGECTRFSPF